MLRKKLGAALAAALLALAAASLLPPGAAAQSPGDGPGGPILVVSDGGFGGYYAEILRAEGLNEFAVSNPGALTPQTLAGYQVVLLATTGLSDGQVSALSGWVQGGGNLIAMRPDARLAGLLGLGSDIGDLSNAYLAVHTGAAPGAGIVGQTMQFHGTADQWTLAGATPVATLYGDATNATSSPAVTWRAVGSAGGQAAAFTYDLARSVVYTRQGNPAWAGDERDSGVGGGQAVRSDDLFFGNKPGDSQADWVNLDKVAIPQADEQQRLLANLITQMNLDRAPLPRFWYLPRGEKAAVVMTGDDHDQGDHGTAGQFGMFEAASPVGCSVAEWQCVRSTSYAYPSAATMSDGEARAYQSRGFEVALHLNTSCQNLDDAARQNRWTTQLASFASTWPGLAAPRTNRTHCIAWTNWVDEARTERANGIRLDTNYYYWPEGWVQGRPGLFTGSGFPMRFADTDGSLVDVYQATTQLTDELGTKPWPHVPIHIQALLSRALGPEGYYAVVTTNMHTDEPNHEGANAIVTKALELGVPVVSAAQMLDWLDGRNGSSFQGVSFSGGRLSFTVAAAPGSNGLEAMVPARSADGPLLGLTRNGAGVGTAIRTVKGVDYAVFAAAPGAYVATYTPGAGPPGSGTAGRSTSSFDRTKPHVKLRRRKIRVSKHGTAIVRVKCPRTEIRCLIDLRLRRHGKKLASSKFTVAGGKTAKVHLRLRRPLRRKLVRAGSLKASAVIRARDAAGNHRKTKTRIRLLAPRR
jgi:hypothetical protein